MPYYYGLKSFPADVRKRTVEGIRSLRRGLSDAGVGERTLDRRALIATWNIREFDSEKFGARTEESYYYIAEIISHFDLVAIQEVREDLRALDRVERLLGSWWKRLVTDITVGSSGNGERLAFLYDSRKVAFTGLAGEIVLPAKKEPVLQFARTPFVCGFKAGWSTMSLCTVHIYYGKATKDDPRRVREIHELAALLAARGKADPKAISEPENLILLGDFNIFAREDVTFRALVDEGFEIPASLQRIPGSNVTKDKHYDQIAVMARPGRFGTTGRGGVFDFYEHVFRTDQEAEYRTLMAETKGTKAGFGQWRTYQMSDHLPMWCELQIDFSESYLADLLSGKDVEPPETSVAPLPLNLPVKDTKKRPAKRKAARSARSPRSSPSTVKKKRAPH